MELDKLLETFSAEGASDLHLAVGAPPMLRTLRGMRKLDMSPLTADDTEDVAKGVLGKRHRSDLEEKGACRFSYSLGKNIFRISVYKSRGNLSLAVRKIPSELPSIDDMEIPDCMKKVVQKSKGLVLICGPAGSGKTSTLHGLVDHLNRTFEKHIITIEDPVEYFHAHKLSMVNQREVGLDVPTSVKGIHQALEQDPDVMVIGEITGYEMVDAALLASETGHLVIATMHAGGTVHALNAILDFAPPNQREQTSHRLAGSLVAVLSQVLLAPKKGEGSVPAYELMLMNSTIASLIRKTKIEQIINVMQTEKSSGMKLLDDSLYELYSSGRITKEDMLSSAIESVEIETRLQVLKTREEEKRVLQE